MSIFASTWETNLDGALTILELREAVPGDMRFLHLSPPRPSCSCSCFLHPFGILWPCYRGHSGPLRPRRQKEFEMSSRGLSARGSKSLEWSRNRVKIDRFLTILTLAPLCFGLGTDFKLCLLLWARRVQMTPVAASGQSFRNHPSCPCSCVSLILSRCQTCMAKCLHPPQPSSAFPFVQTRKEQPKEKVFGQDTFRDEKITY